MTAAIVGVYVHPTGCPVCTDGLAKAFRVGYAQTGGGVHPEVSRLSQVIPCPQCVDAGPLVALLSAGPRLPAPPAGGAA